MRYLPRKLLSHVYWAFGDDPFADRDAFRDELLAYQKAIAGELTWDPDELVFGHPELEVGWEDYESDGELLQRWNVRTSDPRGFTRLELMFQVHNAVSTYFHGRDHHFFEGLSVATDDLRLRPDVTPTYWLGIGS